MEEICDTCYWHKRDGQDWIYMNGNSEYVADYTECSDGCEEWEERE